jgi:hypothetical protein
MTNEPYQYIPAPAGWTFHLLGVSAYPDDEPRYDVYPVLAFRLDPDDLGTAVGVIPSGAGGRTHVELLHTALFEGDPLEYPLGLFSPGKAPDPEHVELAKAALREARDADVRERMKMVRDA